LRGRRHLVLQRRVFLHPECDAAMRILLLGQGSLMQDRVLGDLDVVAQVRAEIEALVSLFGRRPR
jgi:hypothetical protein